MLLGLGGVALALPVLVVGASNLLLRTRLLRDALGASTSQVRLDYARAYSWFPGHVHVEGFTLWGADRHVQWFLTIDRVDVVVSLLDLIHREFHATRVRVSGFTIHARLRLDPRDATPDIVAALPPIPGLADPPILDVGPEPAPRTDAEAGRLWRVHLEDVVVEHAREVWIQTVRSNGDYRVVGRWIFRPGRWLDVGPAVVDMTGVELGYGPHVLATGLDGTIRMTIHPFDLRRNGLGVFDAISWNGELHGHVMMPSALRMLAPGSEVRASRWEGELDARLLMDRGRLGDGGRVVIDSKDVLALAGGLTFAAPVHAELDVARGVVTISVAAANLRVTDGGAGRASVASIAATLSSLRPRMAEVFDDARFALEVNGAQTPNAGAWEGVLPSPFAFRSGTVTARAHAEGSLAQGWAVGTATLDAEDAAVQMDRVLLAGGLAVHVGLRRWTRDTRTWDLSGSDVAVREVTAIPTSGGRPLLRLRSLTVVAPALALTPSGPVGPVAIDIVAKGIRARVGSTDVFGDVDWAVRGRRQGVAATSTDLSGSTLAITRAGTGSNATGEGAWWGHVALPKATFQSKDGARFDANVDVRAMNAEPVAALVSENTAVPAWAANLVQMPGLAASAEIQLASSSLIVRSLEARGGSTSVQAEYAMRHRTHDGAVLVDLGWILVGVDLAEGATPFVLAGPREWFRRKAASLHDAATAVAE